MTISSKRAEYTTIAALAISIIFFGITYFIGQWSRFFAIYAVSWQILSGALIWFVLAVQFHQRSLAEQEKLDISQLTASEKSTTIFQAKTEHAELFAVAQRRLKLIEKWFVPIFAAINTLCQIVVGVYLLKALSFDIGTEPKEPLVCAVSVTAIAFISFLISRYTIGIAAQPQWKPLRAGGSFMLGVAIVCFALAVSLALAQFKISAALDIIGWAIPSLLLVLGAETTLNLILDIYRPRIKGQYDRSAFDSRLLGIISEPGEIIHTVAGTIDYQFGFQVSQTWFYKLLERAIVPLLLFAAITLYMLSSIVIIAPNEEAVIEHFGRPASGAAGVTVFGPGLIFKWPWPVDIAYIRPTKTVSELNIGFVPKRDPKTGEVVREPLLWGKAHFEQEYNLLVACEQTGTTDTESVPISLVRANIPVQYRIKDLYSFLYNHNNPEKLLEAICYRELTKFAASAKIEADDQVSAEQSLFGAGRAGAKDILTAKIQQASDEAGLGVEIVFLSLQGIHPPPEIAQDYQNVIGAGQKRLAIILNAQAVRNRNLCALAGSVEETGKLYSLAARYQQVRAGKQTDPSEALGKELDAAFAAASGEIYKILREAESYAVERSTIAKATGERFIGQLEAYRASKEIYKRQQKLAVLEESLENTRKFVVAADTNDTQVFVVDLQEKLTPGLYDITGLEETNNK